MMGWRILNSWFILMSCIPVLGQDLKNVVLLDQWVDTTLLQEESGAIFNDMWGFERDGEMYAVIGSTEGTHFFHVKEENDSYVLDLVDYQPGKYQNPYVVHRDFKTYKNYLYAVCDEGTSSLQIFDISDLPNSTSKVYDSDEFFTICHNIYIDTARAKLYACAPDNFGMEIYSLADPESPSLIYTYTDVSDVHDAFVRNDTAFLNCGFDGLKVLNFSSGFPSELGIMDFYPNQGYCHSGWLAPNTNQYVFTDETQGTQVKYCEWDDLSTIQITETFAVDGFQDYVPHDVYITDGLAFVAYYNKGFRMFDLTRFPIKEIGHYDTFEEETKFKLNGAWGAFAFPEKDLILISDRQNGLFLFTFPIQLYENIRKQEIDESIVSSTPLIQNGGILMAPDELDEDQLSFAIFDASGRLVLEQSNELNYVEIPIEWAAGAYVYSITNRFGDRIISGKFVKGD